MNRQSTFQTARWTTSLLVLAMIGGPLVQPASADIVTYNNGRSIKGIVLELPDSPDMVQFTGVSGTIRIQRSRILSIQKESPATGYLHIGKEHFAQGHYPDAMGAFKQALNLEPGNAEAQRLLDETQAQISQQDQMSRQQAVEQIDQLSQQAQEAADNRNFEQAESLFKQANDMVPNPEQKDALAKAISALYYKWGLDRLDKYDKPGAESKFNLALSANPDNTDAIQQLLQVWEDNPDKREQTAHIYETILERHPENAELRRKLGDLYAQMGKTREMVFHYLALYKQSDKFEGTDVESRLVEGLKKLHNELARQKDYDKAIQYYQILAAIDPATDPTAVVQYEYLKQADTLKPDDLKGQLALAQFAEKNGMFAQAKDKYRILLKNEETHDAAQAGLKRYAEQDLTDAQKIFAQRNYTLAATLAEQVRKEYPDVASVVEQATELIGKADAEMVRERRAQTERAKDVLDSADQFYQAANQYFQMLFNRETINNPRLISPRIEANKYYRLALEAYQEALRLNPALGQGSSLVNVRIAECRDRLRALNQSPSGGLGDSRYVPSNVPDSSTGTYQR